jgi:hypothetical protein
VRVARGLATELAVAERAVATGADSLIATRFDEHPRAQLEWRPVAYVLSVPARQLGDPVAELVAAKPHDRAHHGT